MVDLATINTGRGQICIDDNFGLVYRSHSSRWFYIATVEKVMFISKHSDKYTILPDNSVPRSMIRKDYRGEQNVKVMCTGCGKMFKKKDMDGSLCRGFDGCSVKKEIEDMRSSFGLRDSRSFS
jgi:hypothetical protein